MEDLSHSRHYAPIKKKLILNLDDIVNQLSTPKLDNLEAMTIGPKQPNGNDTLILASDDNFRSAQRTVFIQFEIRCRGAEGDK